MAKMKFFYQFDDMDCGPACLRMIASYYGSFPSAAEVKENSFILKNGVSLMGLSEAAQYFGFESKSMMLSLDDLRSCADFFPCILHWHQNHFVVLRKITHNKITKNYSYHISDPSHGLVKLTEENFAKSWTTSNNYGTAMFLEPSDNFVKQSAKKTLSIKNLFKYLTPYKKQIILMFFLLLGGSLLTLCFPFLTQNLIDKGISAKNINIILIILFAQLSLYVGTLVFEIIRNWLMLFVGTKVSITIISDFLKNILRLPLRFFDSKMLGDFNQRIADNERIEDFLTSQSLYTFFSILTFSIFFGVLFFYSYEILLLYLLLTTIAILWSTFWLKKRKFLDYFRFLHRGENQESIYEIFSGVTEMKLNQFEDYKRKEWEKIQNKLFKTNIKILKTDQIQLLGFDFFNQIKNILVTFVAALFVVKNELTLGQLLSISYIIGQMNSPVNQLVSFFRSLQDAKLSLERIDEIQQYPAEEKPENMCLDFNNSKIDISIKNVSFQYEGSKSPYALKDINLLIPNGKVTAIVGASGSGKTTLMKMLLKFYEPTCGQIFYGGTLIADISAQNLRTNCGVVMQDGYIFSDTIKRNIATGDEIIDEKKLKYAVKIANLEEFIESLPLKYNTKIGASGNGISGGEKQRVLIARAVYKNPQFLFFDEATSSLDAENEKIIHNNLQDFFHGRTVVIIAHRLSTVKNADNIIVLEKSKIVETGNHSQLTRNKGIYYELVRNQLELGK
jgi:ATP-binding cassette subfamily B protein